MYGTAVVLSVAVVVLGIVAEPDFTVEINRDNGLLEVEMVGSKGLICHSDGSDNIAKVACGGEGTSSEKGAEDYEETPEFSVQMTCNGDEAKLKECDHKIQQLSKCDSFVAVQCGGRRSLRGTI